MKKSSDIDEEILMLKRMREQYAQIIGIQAMETLFKMFIPQGIKAQNPEDQKKGESLPQDGGFDILKSAALAGSLILAFMLLKQTCQNFRK